MKATQKLPDQTTICSALSILAQQQLNFLLQLSLLLPVLLLVFDPCLFCSLDLIFQTIHFFTLVLDDRLKLRIGSFLHLQFCLNILQCGPLLCNLDAHIPKEVIGFCVLMKHSTYNLGCRLGLSIFCWCSQLIFHLSLAKMKAANNRKLVYDHKKLGNKNI